MERTRRRRLALTLLFASVPVQAAMTAGALTVALHAEAGAHGQPATVQVKPVPPGSVDTGRFGLPVSCPSGDFAVLSPGTSPAGASVYEAAPRDASGNVQWYLDTGAEPASDAAAANLPATYRAAYGLAEPGKGGQLQSVIFSCLAPSGH
ncbi:MAG TPA: hypothetical protein VH478_05425 [Trebonia sp.]|jgi:hypothetical protein|nr:hypothetical protein [Trebonia sp.]